MLKTSRRRRTQPAPTTLHGIAAVGAAIALTTTSAFAQATSRGTAPPLFQTRRITLSFVGVEAADVLRAIAQQAGISIAISPAVKSKPITIRLVDVTPLEALRLVSQTAGVDFRRVGNAIIVGLPQDLKGIRVSGPSTPYTLKYLGATAAKALLEGALPYLSVQTAESEPTIVLTGAAEDIAQAEKILAQADTAPRPVSDVFTPTKVTANFLQDVVRKAVPDVTLDVHGNTLVATGPKDSIARIKTLLPGLDTEAALGQKVEIYTIKFSSARSLAEMLTTALPGLTATPSAEPYAPPTAQFRPLTSTGFGATGTTGSAGVGVGVGVAGVGVSTSGAPDKISATASTVKSRQLILSGSEGVVARALTLLQDIDTAPEQIEIEARIVDVTTDGELSAGIQWGGSRTQATGTGGSGGAGNQTQEVFTQGTVQNKVQELNAPDFIRFGRFQRTPFNFLAQLQFLEAQGRSKTLARPSISVIDNEDANIFIGDVLRFQILATSSATAGNAFTVQEVPVGVALLVRPRVNTGGEITLKVHPVVSLLTTRDANGLPQTASREADTTLRVKDGETIVIGGLIRDEDVKNIQQVPLLSRVPLLGEIFRNRQNSRRRSEVLIFLTPHIVKDTQASVSAAVKATPEAGKMAKETMAKEGRKP